MENNRYKKIISESTTAFKDADSLESKIQGLENYSAKDIDEIVRSYAEEQFERAGITGVTIFGTYVCGSRARGNSRPDSDLDVVLYYQGESKDYVLFNVLNDSEYEDENLYIEDVRVDINPMKVSSHEDIARREIAFDQQQRREYDEEVLERLKQQKEHEQ